MNASPVGGRRAAAPRMVDVARLAGVSQQSVSRVVNNKPNVDAALRERVERAIAQLGYQRNPAARALATNRSMNLGVLSLGLSLFGPSEALFGIAQEADRNGYETSLVPVDRADRATMAAAARRLVAGAVDGIVLLTSVQTAVDALSGLGLDVPVVLFGPGTPEDPSIVTVDEESGARAATEHLLSLGHRTVHHVSGISGWLADAARIRGWSRTLSEAGRPVPPLIPSDWTTESGYQAGLRLAEDPSVTAVFASNDHVALGIVKALTERGLRVPEDVSVVGFDDVPQAAFYAPALTTVRVDFAEVGRACVRRILAALDGESDPGVRPARPEVVLRASTAPPARLR